jgi:hypothetical protein
MGTSEVEPFQAGGQPENRMRSLTVVAITACGLATACSIRDDRTVVTPQPVQTAPPPVVYAAPPAPPPLPPDTRGPSRDEYGFRYDAKGNRIDASGRIISPQSTTP